MDEPITITATIDDKVSDFFTFPARPKFTLDITSRIVDTPELKRSGQFGESAASVNNCINANPGGRFLLDTAAPTKNGAGREWDQRTSVSIDQGANPLRICITAHSVGVGCSEDACYHKVIGHLSVLEMTVKKIDY